MRRFALLGIALLAGAMTLGTFVSADEIKTGKAAFGDWSQDAPGVRRHFKLEDMPAPGSNESVRNSPGKVERKPDARPKVPEGFEVEAFATGLTSPRVIRFAPNGDMFVADSKANEVRAYRLGEEGKPEASEVYAANLHKPYGIAFHPLDDPQWVYIANA
jgi:glucose/arabinose dehydrogenase